MKGKNIILLGTGGIVGFVSCGVLISEKILENNKMREALKRVICDKIDRFLRGDDRIGKDMNLNKPYNYRESEKRFSEQPSRAVRKRIKRICDEAAQFDMKEVGDRADGFIRFMQKHIVGETLGYSFDLWRIRHETDAEFESDFYEFLSWIFGDVR